MPLIGFKPNKARLVIEQGKATVLVLRIVAVRDEHVLLTSGGNLQLLTGMLRVREQDDRRGRRATRTTGSIIYVPDSGRDKNTPGGKFQINIAMASDKFAMMMDLAAAGKLPAKFFVDVAGRASPLGSRGFGYVSRGGKQVKLWDTVRHRMLPVTSFTMILPVDMREPDGDAWGEGEAQASTPGTPATNAQVAELADELLVFQSETKHMLNGLVVAIVVICVLLAAINLVYLFR